MDATGFVDSYIVSWRVPGDNNVDFFRGLQYNDGAEDDPNRCQDPEICLPNKNTLEVFAFQFRDLPNLRGEYQ